MEAGRPATHHFPRSIVETMIVNLEELGLPEKAACLRRVLSESGAAMIPFWEVKEESCVGHAES